MKTFIFLTAISTITVAQSTSGSNVGKLQSLASAVESANTAWAASVTRDPEYSAFKTEAPSQYVSEFDALLTANPMDPAQVRAGGAMTTWPSTVLPSSIHSWGSSVGCALASAEEAVVTHAARISTTAPNPCLQNDGLSTDSAEASSNAAGMSTRMGANGSAWGLPIAILAASAIAGIAFIL